MAGATIVPGHAAEAWRQQLGAGQSAPEQIQAAWSALDAHCRKRDQIEQGLYPLPMSITERAMCVVFARPRHVPGCLLRRGCPG